MEISKATQLVIECLEIAGLGLLLMIGAYLWRIRYEVEGYRQYVKSTEKGYKKYIWIGVVLLGALVIKLILAGHYPGYETDMNCFYGWSDMIYDEGFGKFYYLDAFTDYPPGYMAILWVIEAISRLFSIETYTVASRVMIKLVPILADLGAGFILYRMAKEKFSEGTSCLLAGLYVLSPIVVMDSSVWGQVDSVFTLCVLLTGYLCMKGKRIPAYFVFVIGVFIKPQAIIFAPILIWTIIDQVFLKDFSWKKFYTDLIGGICAIGSFFVLSLPFGIEKVVGQYVDTLGQYPYASVNAYNFWGLFGKNWASQEDTFLFLEARQWGMVAIFFAVGLSAFAYFRLRKRQDASRYFVSMSILISTMFIFSVRMHERYMFPIVVLLAAAFIVKPTKEMFFTWAGFSFVQYMNVAHVYKNNLAFGATTAPTGGIIGMTALVTMGLYGFLWFAMGRQSRVLAFVDGIKSHGRRSNKTFQSIRSEDAEPPREPREKFSIRASKKMPRFTKADWIVLGSIMLVYSVFALWDLGKTSAPQTEWRAREAGDTIVLDMGENRHIDMIYMYNGYYENRNFMLEMSQDGNSYETVGRVKSDSVFKWNELHKDEEEGDTSTYNLVKDYRFIKLTAEDAQSHIREIVVTDKDRNVMTPVNASDYPTLFDEQGEFEYPVTFRSGTYFDEIYHARTANEMIEGVYCYENTHPPLGKFFISLGVRMFGMTPFGWRIIGVLFGIGMLPFLYLFARRLFSAKTWAAGAATALFAFDFMHFTQTRISTIDVYGTFFIIAMFFFMYWYSQLSFYDTPLWKTFIPLGLSAVMMGLGCASKWTAVYAAAGMGVFFFAIMFRRDREYRIAKQDPKGVTDGIEHAHILAVRRKNVYLTLGFCVLFFVVIAGLIYLLSYIPFSDGHPERSLWEKMIENQKGMYGYHSTLVADHPYASTWIEWPPMIRPMFYYSQTLLNGLKEGISAFGNPLVWWASIPAFFYMIYRVIRYSDKKALFLSFAFLVQYLPWAAVTRAVFAYHFFPSVPFLTMMIVYVMVILDKKGSTKLQTTAGTVSASASLLGGSTWRKWIYVYVGIAFVLFLLFYPVLSGEPINYNYARDGLKWMEGWVLVI